MLTAHRLPHTNAFEAQVYQEDYLLFGEHFEEHVATPL